MEKNVKCHNILKIMPHDRAFTIALNFANILYD